MFVPMRELLKAAVPIPPVLVLLYVLHALRAGRVIGRWGTYIRATDAGRYWSGIGLGTRGLGDGGDWAACLPVDQRLSRPVRMSEPGNHMSSGSGYGD
jgi:hypothetical protein